MSLGGSGEIGNIQPLCGPCNSSKGQKCTDFRPRGGDKDEDGKKPSEERGKA